MNTAPQAPAERPELALAEGLAGQIERWSLHSGADAATAAQAASAARALCLALAEGHVCLHLPRLPGASSAALRASGVVGTAQAPGAHPLVLDDTGRLYLQRHFDYECRLARRLMRAAGDAPQGPAPAALQQLRTLFAADGGVDWQQLAAALALRRRLLVISGGPGTGKTTTVANLLACLLAQQPQARIALAAPTGKAAARMAEALRQRAQLLPAALRERLPKQASTVHRLLGAGPQGFRHHAGQPLALDLLVVDEASMLDLALATRLLEAVPDHARLVLLGDKDQLAAVESGAVFAELSADPTLSHDCIESLAAQCGVPPAAITPAPPLAPSPLHDSVVWLTRSFRFDAGSAIAAAAARVRDGDAAGLLAQLREEPSAALQWIDDAGESLSAATLERVAAGFAPFWQALREAPQDVPALMQAFERFRVLCAQREGPRGTQALNQRADEWARATLPPTPADEASPWYAGRPVMVLRNDPVLRLFNGDIGLALPAVDGRMWVHFAAAEGGLRAVPASRLPPHETAYALTVHKAQGSEYDEVLVMLPAQANRVLTRELLYTALTRARQKVQLVAGPAVLQAAVDTPTRRHSGLLARLRDAAAQPD